MSTQAKILAAFAAGALCTATLLPRLSATSTALPSTTPAEASAPGGQPDPSTTTAHATSTAHRSRAPHDRSDDADHLALGDASWPRDPPDASAPQTSISGADGLPGADGLSAAGARTAFVDGATPVVVPLATQGGPFGLRAPPLQGLRWLIGQRPSPDPAVLVLVFLGVGERDTPVTVARLARRTALLADQGVRVVGLAEPSTPEFADLGMSSVTWLRDHHLDFPIAALTPDLKAFYAVDGVPSVAVVLCGVVTWRGRADELTDDELAKLTALTFDRGFLRDIGRDPGPLPDAVAAASPPLATCDAGRPGR